MRPPARAAAAAHACTAHTQVEVRRGLVQQKNGRRDEEGLRQGDAHAPAPGHVLGHLVGHLLREAEAIEKLARALFKSGGVELLQPLVDELEGRRIAPLLLQNALLHCLEPFLLVAHNVDNGLERRAVAGRGLGVQVPDVQVVGNVHHARREDGEQRGLA